MNPSHQERLQTWVDTTFQNNLTSTDPHCFVGDLRLGMSNLLRLPRRLAKLNGLDPSRLYRMNGQGQLLFGDEIVATAKV